MKLEEAETIRKMIDGHWNLNMNNETSDLWVSVLMHEDAEQATNVVAYLSQKMHYAPKIVDFKEVMRLMHPPAAPAPFEGDALPEYKRGIEAPEWVWVWSWARFHRDPHEERPFPQQSGHVDETEILTMNEYKELLGEWRAAGSPKEKSPLPITLR
jgi:hypothetical protein